MEFRCVGDFALDPNVNEVSSLSHYGLLSAEDAAAWPHHRDSNAMTGRESAIMPAASFARASVEKGGVLPERIAV